MQYRKSHRWGRPKRDCLICGKTSEPLVHDHCYRHGWLRGAIGVGICTPCNRVMQAVDRGALPCPYRRIPADAFIRHWLKCPDCREIGWKVTTFCVCDHAPEHRSRYACTAITDPPRPWLGTGFRPLLPAGRLEMSASSKTAGGC